MNAKGKNKKKPTKGTKKNKPTKEERLEKLKKDYEDHRLLDLEIARYGYWQNKEVHDAESYKRWLLTRSFPTTGTELLFVRREYDKLLEQGLKLSPTSLDICQFLQLQRKLLEQKVEDEVYASVAEFWKPSMGKLKHAHKRQYLKVIKEGEEHLKNLEPFNWNWEFAHRSQYLKMMEEGEEHLKNLEPFNSEVALDVENITKEGETSMEKGEGREEEISKDIEASMKFQVTKMATIAPSSSTMVIQKELGAEKQKDEGWEEEQEDKNSLSTIAPSSSSMEYESLVEEISKDIEASLKEYKRWSLVEEISKDMEASMKQEFGAEKQKDEGWDEEQEDKKSVSTIAPSSSTMMAGTGFVIQEYESLVEKISKDIEASIKEYKRSSLVEEISKDMEASMKQEFGAEKQKDEGWDEEQEDKKSVSTIAPSSSTMEYERWSLVEEVNKLIDVTLDRSFPGLGEKSMTLTCKEEYGDYQCKNVLSIWPKLIKKGTLLKGPKKVGETIMMQLQNRTDMIEGTPDIRSIGLVTFKLSGKWIAKSLHKLLRDGIHTWAPKLPVEKVMVEIPDYDCSTWKSIAGTKVDIIRPDYIRDTLIRMLEYSKVSVKSSNDVFGKVAISRHPDIWNRTFSIATRNGDAVLSVEVEGERKSFNFGKRDTRDISNSLEILWYELKDGVDWIVCLNPVRHQECVELCFAAAEHAGWISTSKHHGLNFAGYRTRAEAGKLVYLLDNALTRCNFLVKQGKAAEYTAEQVFCCALRYEYLRKHRMVECTFDVDDMLNEKGNTFVSLLNTKNQVHSVLANSGIDINKLKNVSELILERLEVLEKDGGRALGLHLLKFTQYLQQSCLSVLPHILCRYLHDLSQKFTNYNSSYSCVPEVGSVAETSRLILCEATAAVMGKCFQLLGITPVSISGESLLKLLLDLREEMGPKDCFISRYDSVLPSLARHPPKNSRFEIVAIRPCITSITRDSRFRKLELSGCIQVQDKYGMLTDGWGPTSQPDCGLVSLFKGEWDNSIAISSYELVSLGNPINARHSVPLPHSKLIIHAELLVTKDADAFFYLPLEEKIVDVSDFWDDEGDGKCGGVIVDGEDWSVLMYCILIKDAVDTTLEVTFGADNAGLEVKGEMVAYYGDEFPYSGDIIVKGFHMVSLFEPNRSCITPGPVPLRRSKMAVPKEGSLVIRAELVDVGSGKVVLKGCYKTPSKTESHSTLRIDGIGCFLDLKVEWEYLA